ncbi:hypothetical protein M8818_005141 [Zalaria obscura]|uniref:Uncharacterized protein n=1 Tax=Zalaria obscura TaxID=2024903 RepID=A0ACC3SAU1_9PEZI
MDTVAHSPQSYNHIPGLMSIEQWEAEVKDQLQREQASNPSQIPSQPTSKKRKIFIPSQEPVLLPSKPSATSVAELNTVCQQCRLRPEYDFVKVATQQFTVILRLLDNDGTRMWGLFDANNMRFVSKKAAKEKVAKEALARLSTPEIQVALENTLEVSDTSEYWVSILNVSCEKSGSSLPEYKEYQVGSKFYTLCKLKQFSGQQFGTSEKLFLSKKAAKASAAREAVLSLRAQGHLPANAQSKKATIPATSIEDSTSPGAQDAGPAHSSDTNSLEVEPSYTASIPPICTLLGLNPPQYAWTPDPQAAGFISGAAYFKGETHSKLQGPVGEVRRVYGKKNARDQCAKAFGWSWKRSGKKGSKELSTWKGRDWRG